MYTWPTGRSQCPHISWVSDARVTDEQQPTQAWSNHHIPANEQPLESETPTGSEPPPSRGTSRRMVLLWAGLGVSGAAALGAGAFAVYASQSNKQDDTTQGDPGRMPGGDQSGMPRGNRPSGAPSGGFPSGGTRPARNASGMPSGMPTDQPT